MESVEEEGRVVELRVVARGVSPLFWRLVAVAESMSLAVLNCVLRVVFGWAATPPQGHPLDRVPHPVRDRAGARSTLPTINPVADARTLQ